MTFALACARSRGPHLPADDSVTVAVESAPAQLDPRMGADQASERAHELLFDGLVEWDRHARLVPALAERWEELDGGKRWRFHLRPGVRHRVTALVDTVMLEASTTELDDVVRLEDRYGREGTSDP